MGITIGKVIPVHWVNTTYTSVDVIGSGGVYTGMGGSKSFRECKPGVNQWGQAGTSISYTNDSNKEIKYIVFTVTALDSVNSRIAAPLRLQETGPIKPHATKSCQWDYMWQSGALKKLSVDRVSIEYMDGTFEEQAIQPRTGERKLQYDSAAGRSWPSLIAIACIALVLGFMVMRSNGGIVRLSKLLLVALSLITVFFSQRGNRAVAIISAILSFAAAAIPPVMANILDAGTVGIIVMNFLMLLCALGVFKDNKKIIMAVAFGIFCAIAVGSFVSSFISSLNDSRFSNDIVGNIIICIMNIVYGALAWMTGIRCRHTSLS